MLPLCKKKKKICPRQLFSTFSLKTKAQENTKWDADFRSPCFPGCASPSQSRSSCSKYPLAWLMCTHPLTPSSKSGPAEGRAQHNLPLREENSITLGARAAGSIPGLGSSHVPQSSWACAPQLLRAACSRAALRNGRKPCRGSPRSATRESAHAATETQQPRVKNCTNKQPHSGLSP